MSLISSARIGHVVQACVLFTSNVHSQEHLRCGLVQECLRLCHRVLPIRIHDSRGATCVKTQPSYMLFGALAAQGRSMISGTGD